MKKIAILLALVLSLGLISACSGAYTPKEETVPKKGSLGEVTDPTNTPVPTVERATRTPVPTIRYVVVTTTPTDTPEATDEPTQEPTVTQVPTQTPYVVTATPQKTVVSSSNRGEWELHYYDELVTEVIASWEFPPIQPEIWSEFPNVDNPLADFESKDGVEYGVRESLYGQDGNEADIVVATWSYFLFTGDYNITFENGDNFECSRNGDEDRHGCGFMIVNVSDESESVMRDQGLFTGFLVRGRYWNGDELDIAVNAVTSYTIASMLNLETVLNPEGVQNAGGNCSSIDGCESVQFRFFIVSGNELIMWGETTYTE